jgi:hypothetical protein
MELFKTNGELKPRKALVSHHRDYVTDLARQAWTRAREAEHEGLYPKMVANPLYVVDGEEPEMIDNPDYTSFDEWMSEEVVTQVYVAATYDTNGFELTPEIQEVKSLVREFIAPDYLESQLDEYLVNSAEYKAYNDSLKQKELDRVIVTTTTGKQFYGDGISRVDISDAIAIAEDTAQTSTTWKLATGLALVTLDELKEARMLSLQAKGAIIGV